MPTELLKVPNSPLSNGKAGNIYKGITDTIIYNEPLSFSREVLKSIREFDFAESKDKGQQQKALQGRMFEFLMAELLIRLNLTPFYTQASMQFVPLSKFDFLCYNNKTPVVFSTKISLAERWRQTAFEGDSLKRVYRNAKCYLVTANKRDAEKRNADIQDGDCIGIDECLVMGEQKLIDVLKELFAITFTLTKPIEPVLTNSRDVDATSTNKFIPMLS